MAVADTTPVSSEEFRQQLEKAGPFERRPLLAVAVSGGPDSMCLALLAKNWVRQNNGSVMAVIVDHGLRKESSSECLATSKALTRLGIQCEIWPWTGSKPSTGIMQAARQARLKIFEHFCQKHHALHLLTGHHFDDNVETFMMREQRQSGNIGLAGMPVLRETRYFRLIRPLLAFPKSRLLATVKQYRLFYVTDPSNSDKRFWRADYRLADKANPAPPLQNNSQRRMQIEQRLSVLAAKNISLWYMGLAVVKRSSFDGLQRQEQTALMQRLIAVMGRRNFNLSTAKISVMLDACAQGRTRYALGGAIIQKRHRYWLVFKEIRDPRQFERSYCPLPTLIRSYLFFQHSALEFDANLASRYIVRFATDDSDNRVGVFDQDLLQFRMSDCPLF